MMLNMDNILFFDPTPWREFRDTCYITSILAALDVSLSVVYLVTGTPTIAKVMVALPIPTLISLALITHSLIMTREVYKHMVYLYDQ